MILFSVLITFLLHLHLFSLLSWIQGVNSLEGARVYGCHPTGPVRAHSGAVSQLRRDEFSMASGNNAQGLWFDDGVHPMSFPDWQK